MRLLHVLLHGMRTSVLRVFLLCAIFISCTPEDKVVYSSGNGVGEESHKEHTIEATDDTYASFVELDSREHDAYQIYSHDSEYQSTRDATTIIIAPHGGNIEPGTTEIAEAIANASTGTRYGFYSFTGIKPSGNSTLHIASTKFDEPVCEAAVSASTRTIVLHGCSGNDALVCVSGRDSELVTAVRLALSKAGFVVSSTLTAEVSGKHPDNICNRNASGKGVQIELSKGLREQMMTTLVSATGRTHSKTPVFYTFVRAVRLALATDYQRIQNTHVAQ